MNEFRATPPKDDQSPPIPPAKGCELRTVGNGSVCGAGQGEAAAIVPVPNDTGGRQYSLGGLAGAYRAIGDKWLEALNKQVVDSLKGGV